MDPAIMYLSRYHEGPERVDIGCKLKKSAAGRIIAEQWLWTSGTDLYTVPESDKVCRRLCVLRQLHKEAGPDCGAWLHT